MKNYTTQTAALKATTIDTRLLDAKQINTEKLFINGELFDPSNFNGGSSEPSQIKESPNQIMLTLGIVVRDESKTFSLVNEENEQLISGYFENNKVQFDLSELLTILYPDRNELDEVHPLLNLLCSNFFALHYEIDSDGNVNTVSVEHCMLDLQVQVNPDSGELVTIKLGEEDDNFEELYGGYTTIIPTYGAYTAFYMSIPYATPPTQSSTFSLRQPQVSPLSLEKTRQFFEQMLDKSAE